MAITANAEQMKAATALANVAKTNNLTAETISSPRFSFEKNMSENCCKTGKNPSHIENLPRLNKISGQIEGVKKMIEDGRYCPDILIQLKAVRSAIRAIESNILSKHLQHCVAQSFSSETERNKKIAELKTLFDRFEN